MCNMWNSISSFMWLAWCLFLSLLRTRLVNGTVFFRAKRIIVLVFVPVGFFYLLCTSRKQSFQSAKWPFQREATYVRWVFWFSAVNDTSSSNQLPQADFVFQSCFASARVHSWTLNLLSGPSSRKDGYECGFVRRKLWLSALPEPLKLQPSISSTRDVCHQFLLSGERTHFGMELTPI